MTSNRLLFSLALAQLLLGARVVVRMLRGVGGRRVRTVAASSRYAGEIAVVVPVLDEVGRLAPCLEGLIAQGVEVREILVVDGGSRDGTQKLVRAYGARDARVRLVDASPVPPNWNGKAWGLQVGLERADPRAPWLLTIDADVRPGAALARSLLAHAQGEGVPALSVATQQCLSGSLEALLHPSLLTTLVYRFGPPGWAARRVGAAQANGQCFLARRDALERCNAFVVARASVCEDITVARSLVAAGYAVGFYEGCKGEDLVSVEMYTDWRDAWRNWPRSLPMRDQYAGLGGILSALGLCEVTLIQALPLPLCALLLARRPTPHPPTPLPRAGEPVPTPAEPLLRGVPESTAKRGAGGEDLLLAVNLLAVNGALAAVRLGVLAGTARAYRGVPPTYWLSPLCDLPVALRLWASFFQRRHTWRGRVLVDRGIS